MQEIIKTNNLCFSYNNKDIVLDNISLNINQGELVCIIGPNGCGKSTLIKHFNAILKPSSGEVKILGNLTSNPDPKNILNIRKNIAMVFQNPENQIVATIVEEDVAFALENLGVEPEKIKRIVVESLKTVDMLEYIKHSTNQLSGGQKQRVAIASAISMNPRCIIFDEATSMLDPTGRQDVLNLIIKLSKQNNITVIFVTHFMEEACLADRIIVLNKGKIEIDSSPENVFNQTERLKNIGLELPKHLELCNRLKSQNNNFKKTVITVDDAAEFIEMYLKSKTRSKNISL
ncbi:MAG: energy-coupling factor transporter ATPase [Oscillospiraceae bacterium]|nr:energy-coupling factor transporter ATPase [Oscillospiraceae bacterium]